MFESNNKKNLDKIEILKRANAGTLNNIISNDLWDKVWLACHSSFGSADEEVEDPVA